MVLDIFVSDSRAFFGNSNVSTLTPLFDSFTFEQESFCIPLDESAFFNYVFDFVFAEPDYDGDLLAPGNFGWFAIRNDVGPNGPDLVLADHARSTLRRGDYHWNDPSARALDNCTLSGLGIVFLLNRRHADRNAWRISFETAS